MSESNDEQRPLDFAPIDAEMTDATGALEEFEAMPDAEGKIRSGKLAGRSMWSAIYVLALPVFLQQLAAAGLGLCDKMFAGNLPEEIVVAALDGLGIGSYIGWFIGIAMTGLGIGGQALIARAMGAGNRDGAHLALGQAISLSVVWGLIVGVGLWFGAPLIAQLCLPDSSGADFESARDYCSSYIRILAYSMPMCGVMMVGSMCLHGAGETTKPAAIAILINVVNVAFSWALSGADVWIGEATIVNPFSIDWYVDGIAAGTAISYCTGALMILFVLRRGVKDLRLDVRELPIRGSMILRLARIGAPSFLEGISMWAVNIFILRFIGLLGTDGLQGAHIIAVQWESFSFLPGFAIGTAAGALAGQYLGARNPRMARNAVLACTGIAILLMGSLGVVFMTCGEFLTHLISREEVHLEYTPQLLFIAGSMQIFFAITMVIRQGLRGVGDTLWALLLTTVSSYGVRLPAAYLLGVHFGLGLPGIWYGLCGEFFIRACLFSARFLHGGWKRVRV